MNADRLEGLFRQFKGRLIELWGRATGDKAAVQRGRTTAFAGAAQASFGRAMRAGRTIGLRRWLGV